MQGLKGAARAWQACMGRPTTCHAWATPVCWASTDTSQHAQAPIGGYTPVTSALWLERLRHGDSAAAASAPAGITSKSVVYAFSTDNTLRELYRNPWDKIRIGKVFEDLDSLAGSIAFQHCFTPGQAPPLLVTASVDEITLAHPISTHLDITMQGSVAWTGSSSLDIMMTISQPDSEPSLTSLFSFVNLDPKTRKPAPVRPITPSSPAQQALFQERQAVADARKKARQDANKGCGHVTGQTPEARAFTQPLLSRHRQMRELPALVAAHGAVGMDLTRLQNTVICQPQQRNTRGRIFGGFLMGQAYELAFSTTYMFAGRRPTFLKCEEITFKKPVDVGDLLRFHSQVLHAVPLDNKTGLVCVEVEAIVAKPEVPSVSVTNSFNFVFQVDDHPTSGGVKAVLPTNEEDAGKAWEAHQALLAAGYLTAT